LNLYMEAMTLMSDNRSENLDRQIEILKEKVFLKHNEYNELKEQLSKLLEERYPERKTEKIKERLYEAYQQSGRSLEDIIELIKNADEWI